ncbi:MAG: 4Fe-4S dicluster domain-containing protein [Gemmatimonadales bacterium]
MKSPPSPPPPPSYAFGYRRPPRSGNLINGLGEREPRRAEHVFHSSFGSPLEWAAMDHFFTLINAWGVVRHLIMIRWALRRAEGTPAEVKDDLGGSVAAAQHVKATAQTLGARKVGITAVTEAAVYAGREVPFPTAIVLGTPMRREAMAGVPDDRAAVEVMRAYREVCNTAVDLARHIRSRGWNAKAYGDPNSGDLLHVPLAVQAGLGQLGKHGSLISAEYGSNLRLATVVTDLPLAPDQPVDLGVDDFCLLCRVCSTACPPGAIADQIQTVRGVDKWYVDFDRCIPYFTKTKGCAICIEACPWAETGRGFTISEKMLARRRRDGTERRAG